MFVYVYMCKYLYVPGRKGGCQMRRRIHVCHMRRRIYISSDIYMYLAGRAAKRTHISYIY